MSFSKCLCFFTLAYLFSIAIYGQDKIYMESDIRQGKIVEISPTTIKYNSLNNVNQTLIVQTKDALIVFNSKGDYLIPAKLDLNNGKAKEQVAQFLSNNNTAAEKDKDQVFTNKKIRIDGNITKEDDNFVYVDTSKIDKNNIAVIIYKNGHQKVYGSIDTAAALLWVVQQKQAPVSNAPLPSTANATEDNKLPAKENSPAAANETGPNTTTTSTSDPTAKADSARLRAFAAIAGDISPKDFETRAVQKTNKLNEYLKILCSKSSSYEQSNEAIDQSVNLFVSENAMVETSSIKKNTVNHYKIREYLTRVKLFKYDKIEIEWTHVQYVSDLKLGADGNFYGVVTFEQEFRGYRDNQLVYSDITRKNANVVLKTYKKSYEGTTKTIWDVLLSDIGVVYTKSSEKN